MPQKTTASDDQGLDAYWRSIILFGRNVASYKFALAKSLIEFGNEGKTFVSLEELALPFSSAICDHLSHTDKQTTASSSQFLDACRAYNRDELVHDRLISETVRQGFNNVIDAFHVVNQGPISAKFFVDDRYSKNGITITDSIHQLRESFQWENLEREVEARWRLVETAWQLGVANPLLVTLDETSENVVVNTPGRRVNVTSSRGALNGYQKGRCFYCFKEISIRSGDGRLSDIDHFLPWTLEQKQLMLGLNGFWNLVLACKECNRGEGGKHSRIPTLALLQRLETRNNYLVRSHHPLRETIRAQTGNSSEKRLSFLRQRHEEALGFLQHTWQPAARGPATF